MKIIYLHGFASVGAGPKSDAFIKEFGAENVLAPDLPLDPDQVEALIDSLTAHLNDENVIFVGTSLGGFWSQYFALKYGDSCVLVNPSTSPSKTMWERVGHTIHNYKTGTLIPVLEEYAAKFQEREEFVRANMLRSENTHLFVAKDDDVINYNEVLANIPFAASCTVTAKGGHRYDKLWHTVVNKVKELV
jgi:predicted esterase YcpF (UPF0227 family)